MPSALIIWRLSYMQLKINHAINQLTLDKNPYNDAYSTASQVGQGYNPFNTLAYMLEAETF